MYWATGFRVGPLPCCYWSITTHGHGFLQMIGPWTVQARFATRDDPVGTHRSARRPTATRGNRCCVSDFTLSTVGNFGDRTPGLILFSRLEMKGIFTPDWKEHYRFVKHSNRGATFLKSYCLRFVVNLWNCTCRKWLRIRTRVLFSATTRPKEFWFPSSRPPRSSRGSRRLWHPRAPALATSWSTRGNGERTPTTSLLAPALRAKPPHPPGRRRPGRLIRILHKTRTRSVPLKFTPIATNHSGSYLS